MHHRFHLNMMERMWFVLFLWVLMLCEVKVFAFFATSSCTILQTKNNQKTLDNTFHREKMMLMSIEEDELDYQVMNPTAVVKGQLQQVFRSAASLLLLSTTLPKSALAVAEEAATLDQQDLEVISLKDASRFVGEVEANRALNTDEYEIAFDTESLGLRLGEKYYQGGVILTVNDIIDKTMIDKYPALTVGSIVVRVNGEYVENQPLMTIAGKIKASPRPVKIQFRDPSSYFQQLDSTTGKPLRVITTSYLPANTRQAGESEQLIKVERLQLPPPEQRLRASQLLDVMEIEYVAQLEGVDSRIVDSSAQHAPPGSSTRTIYYVLGQRNGPPGQYPPGWDFTLRGMVVGEKRRIRLPYRLAYDRKGNAAMDIPPLANIIYTVRLRSLT